VVPRYVTEQELLDAIAIDGLIATAVGLSAISALLRAGAIAAFVSRVLPA
jgi:hypothetical protein